MDGCLYAEKFYDQIADDTLNAAKIIVPQLLDIVNIESVVDIGCGTGTFLSVFSDYGIIKLLGMDISKLPSDSYLLDKKHIKFTDFTKDFYDIVDDKYDLAVSLEVAEHLPIECADSFIENLTKLSDIVLFSAAIPFQGGIGHVNENWPEFWAGKFAKFDYVAIDCIRPKIWNDMTVAVWYKQNTILYVKRDIAESQYKKYIKDDMVSLSYIHPYSYLYSIYNRSLMSEKDFSVDYNVYTETIDSFKNKKDIQLSPSLYLSALNKYNTDLYVFNNLEKRSHEQETKVKQLETLNQELEAKVKQLEASSCEQGAKNQQLETLNQELEAKVKQLEASSCEQGAKNQQLETLNQELEAKVKQLEASSCEQGAKNQQLETLNQELEAKVKQLEASSCEQSAKNQQLETLNQELEVQNQKLQLENEIISMHLCEIRNSMVFKLLNKLKIYK